MTDFTNARICKCPYCGTPFCDQEGMLCDCYQIIAETEAEFEEEWRRREEENGGII